MTPMNVWLDESPNADPKFHVKAMCDCSECTHGQYEVKITSRPGPLAPYVFRCGKGHKPCFVEIRTPKDWGESGYARRGCEDFHQTEEVGGRHERD